MEKPESPLWKRLAWLAGIWLSSVLALGIVAGVLRRWLQHCVDAAVPDCMVAQFRRLHLPGAAIGRKVMPGVVTRLPITVT